MRPLKSALFVVLLATAACGPRTVELPPAAASAKYPDFVYPAPLEGLGTPAAAERHKAGWLWLQAGDLGAARRNFEAALKLSSGFYPADVGLGYVELARKDLKEAADYFDRAVVVNPRYVPALVGRGEALLGLGDRDMALKSLEAAVVADPSLDSLRARIEVLRVRGLQEDVADARKAAEAGKMAEAGKLYEQAIAASPESAFLYREAADVARRQGDFDTALRQAEKAVELEPTDARAQALVGDIFEARQDIPRAITAYEASIALEPNPALVAKVESLRKAVALAAMPSEYQAIESSPTLSREQLAALVGVRLDNLFKRVPGGNAVVITDTRGSWAIPWIMSVTRAGVMEVYPNHTFQPGAVVRRGDLADAASRVLTIIATEKPALGASWKNAKRQFSDVSPAHLSYGAASATVEAGVMQPQADGSFQLSRIVTGAEAVAAVKKLEELAESQKR